MITDLEKCVIQLKINSYPTWDILSISWTTKLNHILLMCRGSHVGDQKSQNSGFLWAPFYVFGMWCCKKEAELQLYGHRSQPDFFDTSVSRRCTCLFVSKFVFSRCSGSQSHDLVMLGRVERNWNLNCLLLSLNTILFMPTQT